MKVFIIIFIVLFVLMLAAGANTLRVIGRGNRRYFQSSGEKSLTIRSFDGLKLVADVVNDTASKGTILCFHGYHSGPVRDFSSIYELYTRLGCRTVFVHQRAHGRSEGKFTGLGILERKDCLAWINHINDLYGKENPVFLSGVSMGAATVLMAAGEALPENVKGIIADCGFTSPKEILKYVMKNKYHLPPATFLPFMSLVIRMTAGYRTDAYSTLEAMKKNKLPVLFIHGKADCFVPCSMTLENYEAANKNARLLLIEGARHTKSFETDPNRYIRYVQDFILKYEC